MYNLDPEKPEMMDDFTAAMLEKEGKEFSELETEIVEAPFVQVCTGRFTKHRCFYVACWSSRTAEPFGWVQGFSCALERA